MRMRGREAASISIGLLAIAASILAVGGALRWTQALVAALVALALVPMVLSRRVFDRLSPLLALPGIAAGLTAISLVPLPDALLGAINPTGAALREDGTALLAVSSWPALTLDAPGSLRALAHFVILVGIAVVALRLATSERGRYWIVAAVASLCGATAAIVWLHHVFGAKALYGVYELVHGGPHLLGPLLNLNHLACLMAVGAVSSIGLAAYPRQPAWARVGWLVVAGLCGSVVIASVSRGGTLALAAGGFVTLAMLVAQRLTGSGPEAPRRRRAAFLTSSLPLGVVGVCAVILVIYSSAGDVGRKFAATSFDEVRHSKSKFAAWKSAATLIEESPWVGVGRGAFESTFTRVHPASGSLTFSHVENEYLQAAIDWGIPGALLLGLGALWLAAVALRRWRDGPLAAAAIGALVVVAVQSNVDFGIELLGLAVPITALAATVTYVPLREGQPRTVAIARALRIGLVVLLIGSAAFLMSRATTGVDEDHLNIAQRTVPFDEIQAAVRRHPLDYYGYARAAEILTRRGDRRAVPMLNHAMRLHPTHPGLHRIAAQMLHRGGFIEQAALEYAAALRVSARPDKMIGEIVALFPIEHAARAIPSDLPDLDVVARTLDELQRPQVLVAWLSRVLELRPSHGRACELLYERVLRTGDLAAAELTGRTCKDVAPDVQTRLGLASLLLRQSRYTEVIHLLEDVEQWTGRVDEKTTGWLALCDAHLGKGNAEEAKRCLRRLDASSIVLPESVHEVIDRLAEIDRRARAVSIDAPAAD